MYYQFWTETFAVLLPQKYGVATYTIANNSLSYAWDN